MLDLLFNPNGRILRNRFWQGLVILTVASVLVTAGSVMIAEPIGYLTFPLFYMYICVFGKRLHDAGLTAWWVLGVLVGNLILTVISSLILRPFMVSSEAAEIEREMAERLFSGDLAGASEGAQILAQQLLPLNLTQTVLVNFVLALIIGALATLPRENKHGPVPGSGK